MHVLIVEDDQNFVESLHSIIVGLPGNNKIWIADSRDKACEMLNEEFLDLVILDLILPTRSGALDADLQHGRFVFHRIRSHAPGTPIFILTGSLTREFVREDLLDNQHQIDIWSENKTTGTILFLEKFRFDEFPEKLMTVAQPINQLSDVELEYSDVSLKLAEDRLIRIFTKKFKGVRCVVSRLGGGLSGAQVFRLKVTNSQGVQLYDAVAKISTHDKVKQEGDNYDRNITRLEPAATPRKLATLKFGAYKFAGVFFSLATGFYEPAFVIARNSPDESKTVICNVEAVMKPWTEEVPQTRMSIKNIRKRILNDESYNEVLTTFNLDWIQEFENRHIQARWGCSHGDLHGCNVLVSPEGRGVASPEGRGVALIDYGDVGDGPASLDPVTLELSLLFHPDAPDKTATWPSSDQAREWGNLEAYLEGCPFPDFVRECRDWALRAGAGTREVAASAYGYLLRQLKYSDTDKNLILDLLCGVRSFYDEST